MTLFVDTSGLFAVLDADDREHARALQFWIHAVNNEPDLVSTNYVVVETMALVQRRLGMPAVRDFVADLVPALQLEWILEEVHQAALSTVLTAGRRELSFVDCVSFEVMRKLGIKQAFALDRDFAERGFECLP